MIKFKILAINDPNNFNLGVRIIKSSSVEAANIIQGRKA